MSMLQDKFKVATNILLADMETIQEQTIGFMICQLTGNDTDLQDALRFLDSLSITVEVLGYA